VIQSKNQNPILRSTPGLSTFSLKKINTGFYGSFPTPSSSLPLLVLFPFYPVLCLQKGLMTISEGTRSQPHSKGRPGICRTHCTDKSKSAHNTRKDYFED